MTTAAEGTADRQARLLTTLERMLGLETVNVADTLDQAAQLLTAAIHTEKVDIFLYDPAVTTLVAVGTSKTEMGDHQQALGLDRLPLANGGIEAEVFQTGEPFLTGRADEDPRVLRGIKEALGIRSMIVVPLNVGDERRGILTVSLAQPDQYTTDELTFVQAASRWIGMILQRTELGERVAQAAAAAARRLTAEDLINVLAHDFGNLLTPLIGRAYLLLQTAQRDNRTTDIANAQSITKSLQRLQRFIDDLLNVERLEQGLLTLNRQLFDLAALVDETAAILRPAPDAIEVRISGPLMVEGDQERVRQVLENLVTNALKYGSAGAPIVVEVASETRTNGPWAVVTIRDTGPGIAPDLLPRVFDRFVRGDGSQGLGLGLYLAHSIARAHHGTLTVESRPGAGATFTLALPHIP